MQVSASVLRNEFDVPVHHVALIEDRTERKVIQSALRESEKRFRVQFKATPVPIFSWRKVDSDFVLIDYNDAADRLTEHGIVNLLGRRASHLYVQTPEVIEGMNACFDQRRTIRKAGEFRLLSTGALKYFDVSFVFVPPNLVMIHTEDITERKRSEEARLAAEKKYQEIFVNATEGIFRSTEEGRFLDANPAMARILGFASAEELINEWTDMAYQQYVDSKQRDAMKALVAENGSVRAVEFEAYRKDGTKIWLSQNVRAVRDKAGSFLYYEGTAENITERRHAESALRDFSRRLIETQESERKHIARELHDEIGQVLTAVRINLEGLEQQCKATAEIRDGIRAIDEALTKVRDLSFELRPSLLDDLGLAVATRWYADRYTRRAGLKAEVVIDTDLADKRLQRDVETACFRILQESLTNVARHARAKTIAVRLTATDSTLLLSVKDDGVGMNPANQQQRGSGLSSLGLRGMEERALAVSGLLEVFSETNRGTEVRASFPLDLSDSASHS